MMEVLTFFLRFQIKHAKDGTFISQTKPIKTPMGTNGHLEIDLGGTSVDQKVYCSMIISLH
jgi:hypothetical protein